MPETRTLPGQIARLAVERPDRKALVEMGPDGDWISTSWGEYWQAVRDLAKGLISFGLQSGEGVVLVGNNRRDWVISLADIIARGSLEPDDELNRRTAAVKPDDLALLIYTSGTTGVPKIDRIHRELTPFFEADLPVTYLYPSVETSVVSRRVRGLSSPFRTDALQYMDELWLEEER